MEMKKTRINITKKDIIWNYAGSILNLGMSLFILPVILTMLPSNDIGIWFVFSSISGLISLIDFGFSPSISRSVTCAWCGAVDIKKDGLATLSVNSDPNYSLLKSLAMACKKIYLLMSIIAGIILFTAGTYYINKLILRNENSNEYYMLSWIIYAVSIVTNLFFSYWPSFLKGIGAIDVYKRQVCY